MMYVESPSNASTCKVVEKQVDLKGLENVVYKFCDNLTFGSVILLSGNLGSGKTQFVKFLVNRLSGGKFSLVSSPTFSIHNSYVFENYVIDHFDFYRLKSLVDLDSTGFWDVVNLLGDKNICRLIVVEWPGLLKEVDLKMPVVEVSIDYVEDPNFRKIVLSF